MSDNDNDDIDAVQTGAVELAELVGATRELNPPYKATITGGGLALSGRGDDYPAALHDLAEKLAQRDPTTPTPHDHE